MASVRGRSDAREQVSRGPLFGNAVIEPHRVAWGEGGRHVVRKLVTFAAMTGLGDVDAFREAIIGASLELGQALGEDGVTMRAIATKLGTSATTLYTCFESKAAIMRELRMRGLLMLARALEDGLALPSPRESLHAVARCYIAFARDNPWLYSLLFIEDTPLAEAILPPQHPQLISIVDDLRGRLIERYTAVVGRPPGDANRFFAKWWSAAHGVSALLITRRIRNEHPVLPIDDIDGFLDEYIRATTDGLLG